jgi:hypothetical protein
MSSLRSWLAIYLIQMRGKEVYLEGPPQNSEPLPEHNILQSPTVALADPADSVVPQ